MKYIKWLIIFGMLFPALQQMAQAERGYAAFGGEWVLLIVAPFLISVWEQILKEIKNND